MKKKAQIEFIFWKLLGKKKEKRTYILIHTNDEEIS
jgi:hypothetical protein